jgi:hypothetical protein
MSRSASTETGSTRHCRLYAALLQVRQQVSGPKHPETLFAQHNLACWTGEAGNPASPCAQMAELGALMEQLWLSHIDDASPMLSLIEPYDEGLRSAKPVTPIVKFDMAIARDLKVIIDAMLGQYGQPGALRLHRCAPLRETQGSSLARHSRGHLITVVVLCALLLTMPWWSDGLSPSSISHQR